MGPYELIEVVGAGGMGTVHKARHRERGHVVAVKVMKESAALDSVLLERFFREGSALARLRHPNLVRGLDMGVDGERPYLVMEYVEGKTLAERIVANGPLPLDEALRVFTMVAAAVGHIHESGLIHRDIKPANILMNGEGVAKLADLGLTKDRAAQVGLTSARAGMGTLAYSAPEQYEAAITADPRSDVYALGASLYHALTGVPPFQEQIPLVVLRRKIGNDFVPAGRLLPRLPSGVDYALRRSMAAEPEERQSTCAAWLESLLGFGAPPPDATANRRSAARFPSVMKASCGPAQRPYENWDAQVRDLSLTGTCLEIPMRLEPGTSLRIGLLDDALRPILPAVVRWARPAEGGAWWVGCQFGVAMTEPELVALLGGLSRTKVTS